MEEITSVLDTVKNYGLPFVLSGLFIWGVVDLYSTLKKQWAPEFLGSFRDIADNVKGLNGSVEKLTVQSPKIDEIHTNVETIKVNSEEDFQVVKTDLGSIKETVSAIHNLVSHS